jgi:hypothetical protein
MLGLPPEWRAQTLFTQQLPSIVAALRPDVPHVLNSPTVLASEAGATARLFATRGRHALLRRGRIPAAARRRSPCVGGIVWQLPDLLPGAGWGVIDALGASKSAWHGFAQVLRLIAAHITDEGLDGLDVHLINETAASTDARLELACLRDGATKSGQCVEGRHTHGTQHGTYPGS